jgi:hypothetical protein
MQCAAPFSHLVRQPGRLLPVTGLESAASTVVPSHGLPADLTGNKLRSPRWSVAKSDQLQ